MGIFARGRWNIPEKKPVVGYVHVFLWVDVTFEARRSEKNGVR